MIQKLRKKLSKGFTLIELIIVITIIGILSAIAIPNYLTYKAKYNAEKAKQEVVVEKSKPEIENTEKPRPEPGLKKITRCSKNYEICIYC